MNDDEAREKVVNQIKVLQTEYNNQAKMIQNDFIF